MKHYTIFNKKKKYASFPSLALSKDGSLIVAFRVEPRRYSPAHINTRSFVRIMRSVDRGRAWHGTLRIKAKGKNGIQDPKLLAASGGLCLGYFTWSGRKHTTERNQVTLGGSFLQLSEDDGQSWRTARPIAPGMPLAVSSLLDKGTHSAMAGYADLGGGGAASLFFAGLRASPRFIAFDRKGRYDYLEPSLIDCGNDHLLCMMRVADKKKRFTQLYQAHSWDGGATWMPPRATWIRGAPAHLLKLANGDILCTYGWRQRPFGIRACLSKDDGLTWDVESETVIRTNGGGWDIGYPSTVQLKDGSLLTAYYFYTRKNKTRRIECTRWRI